MADFCMHLIRCPLDSLINGNNYGVVRVGFRLLLILLATLLFSLSAMAQPVYDNVYRPAHPPWYQLSTPHFRIIYQDQEQSAAIRSARILEDQYTVIQSLVGGSLSRMPVVLNSANDRSNGYVTTLNFRIEIEIPRLFGKTMNPRDGNWLNTVVPHELVHALHLNVIPTFGVSGLIRPFSPDAARTMHMAAPGGMIEGIAVFHESHLRYGVSGRGNYPYFTRQYQSVFESNDRWTAGQTIRDPLHSFPFDRHYIGGFTFINWLQYEYGMETTAKTIRFVSRLPFLGYGSALWYHTGDRPSRIFRKFENAQKEVFRQEERYHTEIFTSPHADDFMRIRRPFWISNETVLFFAASYNKRPGIYRLDIAGNDSRLILETLTTQDYAFAVHPEEPRFLYARYHRHPYMNNISRMRVHEVNFPDNSTDSADLSGLHSGKATSRQIGNTDRVHSPVYGPDNEIWALQTHHENNMIVRLTDQKIDTLLIPESGHFVEIAFHPVHRDSLALLANRDGLQGLWFLHKNELEKYNTSPPDISFDEASVYDPDWHPAGSRLLFTADIGGTMNLYEYEFVEQKLIRLSDHPWGLMEGHYSPDGNRIAAVQMRGNKFELVLLVRDDLIDVTQDDTQALHLKDRDDWDDASHSGSSATLTGSNESTDSLPESWSMEPYRTGIRWLRPRAFFPYWQNESNVIGNRIGIIMSGGDVLRKNSYFAEASTSNSRFWCDLSYRYTGFYPGFRLTSSRGPIETTSGLWERQSGELEIPFSLLFDRNTRTSTFEFTPGISLQQQRIITIEGNARSNWVRRTAATATAIYRHRLQQNIRDVQPNTGWIFFAETEMDLASDFVNGRLEAFRGGIYRYLSPYLKSNQSLRIGTEFVTQNVALYDITGFYSRGFDKSILSGVNTAGRINTRYTIPIWYMDRGSIAHPFYFDRLYMVLFSETIVPLDSGEPSELYHRSRSLYGSGIRLQMRLFNIPFELGIAVAYEPTRDHYAVYTGSF